jgi:hypothetical protein
MAKSPDPRSAPPGIYRRIGILCTVYTLDCSCGANEEPHVPLGFTV